MPQHCNKQKLYQILKYLKIRIEIKMTYKLYLDIINDINSFFNGTGKKLKWVFTLIYFYKQRFPLREP